MDVALGAPALGALPVLGRQGLSVAPSALWPSSLGDRAKEGRESSRCCLHKVSVGSL